MPSDANRTAPAEVVPGEVVVVVVIVSGGIVNWAFRGSCFAFRERSWAWGSRNASVKGRDGARKQKRDGGGRGMRNKNLEPGALFFSSKPFTGSEFHSTFALAPGLGNDRKGWQGARRSTSDLHLQKTQRRRSDRSTAAFVSRRFVFKRRLPESGSHASQRHSALPDRARLLPAIWSVNRYRLRTWGWFRGGHDRS